jgi:hypothetical protein
VDRGIFAASPPDVRKVSDLPEKLISFWGYAPSNWSLAFEIWGTAPARRASLGRSQTFRTSGGEAAKLLAKKITYD